MATVETLMDNLDRLALAACSPPQRSCSCSSCSSHLSRFEAQPILDEAARSLVPPSTRDGSGRLGQLQEPHGVEMHRLRVAGEKAIAGKREREEHNHRQPSVQEEIVSTNTSVTCNRPIRRPHCRLRLASSPSLRKPHRREIGGRAAPYQYLWINQFSF